MDNFQDKKQRIPHDNVYNIFITIILAILILWLIYIFIPYNHFNLYIIEPKNNQDTNIN